MRFLPYHEAASVPNIVVDGAASDATVVTLSHWPKSGTPAALKADTSAEIVFRYLDAAAFHVNVDAVSNNHFDEDGLIGLFALLAPEQAVLARDLLVDTAQAGDFGVYRTRQAARIAFTLSAYADPETSPLPRELFRLAYADRSDALYEQMLGVVPELVADIDAHRPLWRADDEALTGSERLLDGGAATIDDRPDLDLAVVRSAEGISLHPFAVHSRTPRSRLAVIEGAAVEVRYRYESWVQLATRRPPPRVDLSGLASELTARERGGSRWIFDGVNQITPTLRVVGDSTSIPADVVLARLEHHLRTGSPAWDPYD
jgi:hypothetical protein